MSLLTCAVGAAIYVLFREPVIFTRHLIGAPLINLPDCALRSFILYHAADALWCLALLIYADTFTSRWLKVLAAAMPFMMETAQLFGAVPGTFDVLDMATYAAISIIFYNNQHILSTMKQCKTRLALLANIAGVAVFAIAALASSSSKDVYDHIDSFSEGWQYGKSLTSDATDQIAPCAIDSVASPDELMALTIPEK